jgi:hypothetical protein
MEPFPDRLILVEDTSTAIGWWERAITDLSWIVWVEEENYPGTDPDFEQAVSEYRSLEFKPDGIHPSLLDLAKNQPTFFADTNRVIACRIDTTTESFDKAISYVECLQHSAILWLDFMLDDAEGKGSDPKLTEYFQQKYDAVKNQLPANVATAWQTHAYEKFAIGGCALAIYYKPNADPIDPVRILVPASGLPPNLMIWKRDAVTNKTTAIKQGLEAAFAAILVGLNKWVEIRDKQLQTLERIWTSKTHKWFAYDAKHNGGVPHQVPQVNGLLYTTARNEIQEVIGSYFSIPDLWVTDDEEWETFYDTLKDLLGKDTSPCCFDYEPESEERGQALTLRSSIVLIAMAVGGGDWLARIRLSQVKPWSLVPQQNSKEARRTCITFFNMIRKIHEAGELLDVDVESGLYLRLKFGVWCFKGDKALLKALVLEDKAEPKPGDLGQAMTAFLQAVRRSMDQEVKKCSVHLRPADDETRKETFLEITTWMLSS